MNVVEAWRERTARLRMTGTVCENGCGVRMGNRMIGIEQFNEFGLRRMGYQVMARETQSEVVISGEEIQRRG